MLGPSGCGKTTTLRMIAGFEDPTAGRIILEGKDVSFVPPAKRNVNMVFQAYGLFPHMTVRENVAFGLKIKKVPEAEIAERVRRGAAHGAHGRARRPPARRSCPAASSSASRWPAPSSTGRPPCCSTSPWGPSTSSCARRCSSSSSASTPAPGTTFVYVTHDQEEALTMSQRIAVMKDGVVAAGGDAARALREAGERLRRRLHRHLQRDQRAARRASATASP